MKYNVLVVTVVYIGEETCQRMKRHDIKILTELNFKNFIISVHYFFPPTSDGSKIRQNTLYVMLIKVNCSAGCDILFLIVVFAKEQCINTTFFTHTKYALLSFTLLIFLICVFFFQYQSTYWMPWVLSVKFSDSH
jgi:hypothetical protein